MPQGNSHQVVRSHSAAEVRKAWTTWLPSRAAGVWLALLIALIASCQTSGGVSNYAEQNTAIINAVNLPQGWARIGRPVTRAARADDGKDIVGWTTIQEVKLPGRMSRARVIRLVEEQLVDWRRVQACCADELVLVKYEHAGANLSVNTENADFAKFELVTDAHGTRTDRALSR